MNRCLTLFGYNMENIAPRRPLLLRFNWPRTTIAATLGSCLTCVLLLAGSVHALDPNKRVTQYIHTSWRTQDGSRPAAVSHCANVGRFSLVHISSRRYQQVRRASLSSWRLPAECVRYERRDWQICIFGDHAGGLWVFGLRGIVHLKGGVVTSQFELEGIRTFQNVS